jgi:DNA-binding NtrC family response regulator
MTKWFLTNFGFVVDSVRCAEEALAVFNPKTHRAVITDNSMSGMSGADMAHIIKTRSPSTPILMYTGAPPPDRSYVDIVILRPSHLITVKDALENLLMQQH